MNSTREQLQQISEIRNMMERSSTFLSLSGLTGVAAGTIALLGAGYAYFYLNSNGIPMEPASGSFRINQVTPLAYNSHFFHLMATAVVVLFAALALAIFFNRRKARQHSLPLWDATATRMAMHMAVPLITGGIICMQLYFSGLVTLIAPMTLIFYGVSLFSAGKFTLGEIRMLGLTEILLGLINLQFPAYSLIYWALGFGVLHIVYGIAMYLRYER